MKVAENQVKIQSSRALPDSHSGKEGRHMEDNRVSQQKIAQLQTEIEYNTGEFLGSQTGSNMHALLDPDDPVNGSEPGTNVQKELMLGLKTQGYKAMVRGHLLNAELGGLGIAANLFPITSQANSKHKMTVENPVKDFLTNAAKNGIDEENRLEYEVGVEVLGNGPAAIFHCNAGIEGCEPSITNDITSEPQVGSTGSGSASDESTSMSFRNSNLPEAWGHRGRGYDAENELHTATMAHTQIDVAKESTDEGIEDFGVRQYLWDIWGSSDKTINDLMLAYAPDAFFAPMLGPEFEESLEHWQNIDEKDRASCFDHDAVYLMNMEAVEEFIMTADPPYLKQFADFWGVEFDF